MIEISRDAQLRSFFEQADAFLAEPDVLKGMDLDDAVVKLKRLLLTSQADPAVISRLNRFARLIREMDIENLRVHIGELRTALAFESQ